MIFPRSLSGDGIFWISYSIVSCHRLLNFEDLTRNTGQRTFICLFHVFAKQKRSSAPSIALCASPGVWVLLNKRDEGKEKNRTSSLTHPLPVRPLLCLPDNPPVQPRPENILCSRDFHSLRRANSSDMSKESPMTFATVKSCKEHT